jgi:error-prone DNA polymerase
MGFYSPSQIIQDARRHQVTVLPVDVRYSECDHALERVGDNPLWALRLGFRLVKGLRDDAIDGIAVARQQRPFRTLGDFRRRTRLPQDQIDALIAADALHGLSGHRHQTHWEAATIDSEPPLELEAVDASDGIDLPAPTEIQELTADYNSLGLTLGRHPLELLRERYPLFQQCKRQTELVGLNQGRFVRVAGVVTGRQRPGTKAGVVFLTLEDETGNVNVIVWKDVQERCRDALLKSKLLLIKGTVETDHNVTHVIAGDLVDCSSYLDQMRLESRDFH